MSEIKSSIPKEVVEAWMEDNNLTVLNHYQMCCKILVIKLDSTLEIKRNWVPYQKPVISG